MVSLPCWGPYEEERLWEKAKRKQSNGITISIKKIKETEVLPGIPGSPWYHPGTSNSEPNIMINNTPLKNVEDFTYLSSCLFSSSSPNKEISCSLAKVSCSFGLWVWHKYSIT
jgi:hypothetical protein